MIGFRPKTSVYLERPRLLKLLPDSPGYVVWLEAPYGYGKSVLTSQWAQALEAGGWQVLWLSVQGRDLKTSLASLLTLSEKTPWEVLLEALWLQPMLLVLEDLDGSEDLSPLLNNIRGLLLLASRNTLPYQELPRLQTQQVLIHLGARELAFTPEEALKLFDDKDQARVAWERSQGWSLPLHFAALTNEAPHSEALLEGIQESLSLEDWNEALLLAALPYLPFDKATTYTQHLAQQGFAQELESGFRLHPLAAETIQSKYLEDIQKIVKQENLRLPLILKAEAFARTGLLNELTDLLETELELVAEDPKRFLDWDALCSPERGPGRLLALAYAQSVLGQLDAAYKSYLAVVGHQKATADQKLIALGWWIFDLATGEDREFQRLLTLSRTFFNKASAAKVGAFLFNASAFPFTNHDWETVEELLLESLEAYQHCQDVEAEVAGVQTRLSQVRWELKGDIKQLIRAIENNLRFQDKNPYNAPVNYAGLARLLALCSDPKAQHYFEQAEQEMVHNPATAISASAEKAALLGDSTIFSKLLAQFRPWQTIDPKTQDRLYGLWAKTLRQAGQPQAALEVLSEAQGLYAQSERALALAELGKRQEALEHLPNPDTTRLRFLRIELQTARYLLTKDETDLDALLDLTTEGPNILPTLLPLQTLPSTRSELSKVYPLSDVLASNWSEAIALRHHEIPNLELRVLGKFEAKVLGHNAELTDRHKAILALMALGHNRETIGEALWPEARGKKVLNNLHVQLNLLRKILEPWGLKTYLTEDGLEKTTTDIHQLRAALTNNDAKTILQLYHEPLAPGVDLALLDETRETLRQEVVDCLFEAGQKPEGLVYLQRLLELDPLHEEALQLLLEKLIARGRKREAVKHYQSFATKLRIEMGLEPLEKTRALLT